MSSMLSLACEAKTELQLGSKVAMIASIHVTESACKMLPQKVQTVPNIAPRTCYCLPHNSKFGSFQES